MSYSRFIRSLHLTNISLNRKVLSELAATEPFTFKSIVDVVKYENQIYYTNKMKQDGDSSNSTSQQSSPDGSTNDDLEQKVA